MKFTRLFAAPLVAALLLATPRAFAQPDALAASMLDQKIAKTAPDLAPLDGANWRAIRVENVPPSMIAYMLDSQHNKMPAFFNMPWSPPPKYAADYQPQKPDEKRVKGPFDLPDNVRLAAADEQNLLFVAGANAEAIAQIQELVSILDQPTRFVEIEAQVVELPVTQLKQFGIDFPSQKGDGDTKTFNPGTFQVGFVRNNFQNALDELIDSGTAKLLSTKPLTIGNNYSLAVSLRSGPIDNTGANQNKRPVAPAEGSDTILMFQPTINGDNTITVLMGINTLPKNINSSGLMTVANVRDGQTIALSGLRASAFPRETNKPPIPMLGDIPLINSTKPSVPMLDDIPVVGALFRSKKADEERAVLVFVTARLAR